MENDSDLEEQEVPAAPAQRKRQHSLTVGGGDHVLTPAWLKEYIYSEFPCDYDPCPVDPKEDGLKVDWQGFAFCNPPYSETQAWVEKAALEASKGNFSVLLVPAVFNSVYWRETVYQSASEIRIFKCPIRFEGFKKQIVTQMCLLVFAGMFICATKSCLTYFIAEHGPENGDPPVVMIEPPNWGDHYYKRRRNQVRFRTRNA